MIFTILSIETSCDDTSVSILKYNDGEAKILSNVISSQNNFHEKYGGIVPELAARKHNDNISYMLKLALKESNITIGDIDYFSATSGPGLIGSLLIGMTVAKSLAVLNKKPFIPVNHLEGHAVAPRIHNSRIEYPYLLLLVSGGHCQIIIVNDIGEYELIGESIDDALGETFDKVARLINLPYPGGPSIEKLALDYNGKEIINFPKPLFNKGNDFSFSGLKTSVRSYVEKKYSLVNKKISHDHHEYDTNFEHNLKSADNITKYDQVLISYSFQKVIVEILINKLEIALNNRSIKRILISGGVSANKFLFEKIRDHFSKSQIGVFRPAMEFCTDNAAMIAWATYERVISNKYKSSLDFKAEPRWSLIDIDKYYQ